jgi:hypothetical protein
MRLIEWWSLHFVALGFSFKAITVNFNKILGSLSSLIYVADQ